MKTKDNIEVQVGQVWECLNKRDRGRRCEVVAVIGERARLEPLSIISRYSNNYRKASRVNIRRMHAHARGFRLIREA